MGRYPADCFAGLPGDGHQPRRTGSMVRVEMDLAGAACGGGLLHHVSMAGIPPRKNFAGISFSYALAASLSSLLLSGGIDCGSVLRCRPLRRPAIPSLRPGLQCLAG